MIAGGTSRRVDPVVFVDPEGRALFGSDPFLFVGRAECQALVRPPAPAPQSLMR